MIKQMYPISVAHNTRSRATAAATPPLQTLHCATYMRTTAAGIPI